MENTIDVTRFVARAAGSDLHQSGSLGDAADAFYLAKGREGEMIDVGGPLSIGAIVVRAQFSESSTPGTRHFSCARGDRLRINDAGTVEKAQGRRAATGIAGVQW